MRAIRPNIKEKKGIHYFSEIRCYFSFTAFITEECPLLAGCAILERAQTVFTAISILFDLRCTAYLSAVD